MPLILAGVAVAGCAAEERAATALVRISSTPPSVLEENSGSVDVNAIRRFAKTQRDMARSFFVLQAALRNPALAKTLAAEEDPMAWLLGALEVEFSEESEIMQNPQVRESPDR